MTCFRGTSRRQAKTQVVRSERLLYCSIKGRIDRFCPWGFFTTQAQVDTGIIDVVWEGNPNISRINNATTLGIYANTEVARFV